jgi:hypothetical protein
MLGCFYFTKGLLFSMKLEVVQIWARMEKVSDQAGAANPRGHRSHMERRLAPFCSVSIKLEQHQLVLQHHWPDVIMALLQCLDDVKICHY